jgi:hypothetical protein
VLAASLLQAVRVCCRSVSALVSSISSRLAAVKCVFFNQFCGFMCSPMLLFALHIVFHFSFCVIAV